MHIKPQTIIPADFPIKRIPSGESGAKPKRKVGPRVGPAKTRKVDLDYYRQRLADGCPHCNSELEHRVKGYRVEVDAFNADDFVYLGVYSACFSIECPVKADGVYYYVSPTCERVFGKPTEEANHVEP